MNEIFRPDHKLYQILSRVYQIVILQGLFLLTVLPVVTIGAGLAALSQTWRQILVKKEGGSLASVYFKAFKENFKKSTILWGILLLFLGLIYLIYPLIATTVKRFPAVSALYILLMAIFLLSVVWLFPLQAHFENSVWNSLKNSFLFGFANIAWSIVLVVIQLLVLLIFPFFLYRLIFLWIMTGFGLSSYLSALVHEKVFRKYLEDAKEALPEA